MPEQRLDPHPWQHNYLILRALQVQITAAVRAAFAGRTDIDVIDVGCGARPYEPILAPYARRYVGVDVHPGPGVDLIGSAESLPVPDASFDCAMCSQVLEHAESPPSAVGELHRVLRRGGVALASTHGVYRYHPSPDDYWRWTHAGLMRLFTEAGPWRRVEVIPNGDFGATLATLVATEARGYAAAAGLERAARPLLVAINALGRTVDRVFQRRAPSRVPGVAPNYLVVATR